MLIQFLQAMNQNQSMDDNIAIMQRQITKVERETVFLRDIYRPYLESELAYYILMHEQWLLLPGEQMIRLEQPPQETVLYDSLPDDVLVPTYTSVKDMDTDQAWQHFYKKIIETNFR